MVGPTYMGQDQLEIGKRFFNPKDCNNQLKVSRDCTFLVIISFSMYTSPAPGVLCEVMLEMNKMDERGVKQSSAHYVYNASWTPMPNHLAIPEPVPRALVVLLGLPILNFSSLRSRGAAGAEPGHRQDAL